MSRLSLLFDSAPASIFTLVFKMLFIDITYRNFLKGSPGSVSLISRSQAGQLTQVRLPEAMCRAMQARQSIKPSNFLYDHICLQREGISRERERGKSDNARDTHECLREWPPRPMATFIRAAISPRETKRPGPV